ncbi:LacI family DNA-binding transcriptional regulator [Georgenia phoenicis]|uniref:LacI family DNA-binding transcriptional regulator n=1 Tax=unclassified Georgenia TaxID=2626815 RepID=UPI0039AF9080
MRATAHDVGRLAGVSVSTVSRALTAPDKVSPDTRRRVLESAEQLGYRPSRAARDLATGRTENIGLVIPDLENPYFSSITKAVHARAHALGFHLFVTDTDEDPRQEPDVIRRLARDVDGIILCSPRTDTDQLLAHARETRIVLVNRETEGLDTVVPDNADGVRQALRHLAALGHREVAYAGGPGRSWADAQRRVAVATVGAELGLSTHDLGTFMPYFSGGVAAADLLLASPATAVVVFNDLMALGLLDRVKGRGVEVPRDLSIVSFDDIMFASAVTPHLSSVAFPNRLMARQAIELLLADDGSAPARHLLPMELKVRASSGPAPTQ